MEREIWNDVYDRVEAEKLPWYGISLSDEVRDFLDQQDRAKPVLVTGVGVGDIANEIYAMGFSGVIATDISDTAIAQARLRFPHIRFEAVATESLNSLGLEPMLVIDWLVIHHVAPDGVPTYLQALAAAASQLVLAYLYKEGAGVQESYVKRNSPTYNHDPRTVEGLISDFQLDQEIEFAVTPNQDYDGKERKHGAILQFYPTRK